MSAANDFDPSVFAEIPDPLAERESPVAAPSTPPAAVARPTRATVARRRAIALAGALAWIVLTVVVLGFRNNFDALSALVHFALPSVLGLALLLVAFSPGRLGLGPSAARATLLAIAGPLVFLVIAAVLRAPIRPEDHRDTFGCGAYELGIGLVPFILAAVALRRTNVANAPWRSALVGAGLGLVWAGLWAIHCADEGAAHVVLAHGGPVVAFALLGGFVLGRLTRVR